MRRKEETSANERVKQYEGEKEHKEKKIRVRRVKQHAFPNTKRNENIREKGEREATCPPTCS